MNFNFGSECGLSRWDLLIDSSMHAYACILVTMSVQCSIPLPTYTYTNTAQQLTITANSLNLILIQQFYIFTSGLCTVSSVNLLLRGEDGR